MSSIVFTDFQHVPLPEAATWVDDISMLLDGFAPTGGVPDTDEQEGLLNLPIQQLANRTGWLRALAEAATPVLTGGENGGIRWPSGHELKVGRGIIAAPGDRITFPVAFQTACHMVLCGDGTNAANANSAVDTYGVEVDSLTRTSFRVRAPSTATSSNSVYYIAWGS